jgi:hypothetical protein
MPDEISISIVSLILDMLSDPILIISILGISIILSAIIIILIIFRGEK